MSGHSLAMWRGITLLKDILTSWRYIRWDFWKCLLVRGALPILVCSDEASIAAKCHSSQCHSLSTPSPHAKGSDVDGSEIIQPRPEVILPKGQGMSWSCRGHALTTRHGPRLNSFAWKILWKLGKMSVPLLKHLNGSLFGVLFFLSVLANWHRTASFRQRRTKGCGPRFEHFVDNEGVWSSRDTDWFRELVHSFTLLESL